MCRTSTRTAPTANRDWKSLWSAPEVGDELPRRDAVLGGADFLMRAHRARRVCALYPRQAVKYAMPEARWLREAQHHQQRNRSARSWRGAKALTKGAH
jgi:hypothetical protein